VLNCIFGAGKTQLVVAMVLIVLRNSQAVRLIVSEPTRAMCDEAYSLIAAAAKDDTKVARMGLDERSGVDHFESFLERASSAYMVEETLLLKAVDSAIALLKRRFLRTVVHTGSEVGLNPARVVRDLGLVRKLLALRHHYLDEHLYRMQVKAQEKAVEECRVFVVTPAQRNKWAANFTQWTVCLKTGVSWGLIVDECHQIGFEEGASCLGLANWAVFLGDDSQSPGDLAEVAPDVGDAPTFILKVDAARHVGPQPRPLAQHNLMSWLLVNKQVHLFPLQKTWRLGTAMLGVIQRAFPGKLDSARSVRPSETLFVPVIFEGIKDWVYNTEKRQDKGGETVSSQLMFSHFLASFALEVILLVDRRRTKPTTYISIVSYLLGVLDALAAYLRRALPIVCEQLHKDAGLPQPIEGLDVYSFDKLVDQGAVHLLGAKKSGGFSSEVSFLISTHNTCAARAWAGDALKPHLLRIGLSRATHRPYLFLEDLSGSVQTPNSSGTRNQQLPDPGELNMARYRMPWVRLVSEAENAWKFHLQVVDRYARRIGPGDWNPSPPMFSTAILTQFATEGDVGRGLSTALGRQHGEVQQRLLTRAWDLCEVVAMSAASSVLAGPGSSGCSPGSASAQLVRRVQEVFNQSKYWEDILSSEACREAPPPKRRLPRHEDTYRFDDDSDAEDNDLAPETFQLRDFWSAAVIPAVTVHVQSAAHALVMVPVLKSLLLPQDDESLLVCWPSAEAWPSHAWNPNWLIREITAVAASRLVMLMSPLSAKYVHSFFLGYGEAPHPKRQTVGNTAGHDLVENVVPAVFIRGLFDNKNWKTFKQQSANLK
jgi:hypothetical protein